MKFEAVLFDFDGTLVNVRIDFAEMRRRIDVLSERYCVYADPKLYILERVETMFNELSKRDRKLAESFRSEAERSITDVELDALKSLTMFDGADDVLRCLSGKGIKVGIVTRNCRDVVLEAIRRMGFVYDVLLTRNDVQRVKPDPKHLLDALNVLNCGPENSLMVGDQPMDVIAGKKAGMKTAAVLTLRKREDFDDVSPDLIFEKISDILKLI